MDEIARLDHVGVTLGGVRVLEDIVLGIRRDAVTGLVGESGSGKTSLCRVLMGLVAPASGRVVFDGVDIATLPQLAFRRRAQMLLQDAAASLSPRMRVAELLEEPLRIHGLDFGQGRARIVELLRALGLPPDIGRRVPHQLSGGQARRVAIARALLLRPELVVADEPTAGLDVSVQGDLLNLLLDLRASDGLTYLMVSHNLDVIRRVAGRIVVMYLGQVVEEGATAAVFVAQAHPYTAALLSANQAVDPARRRSAIVLAGEIPSLATPPGGCRFHTRCPVAQSRCATEVPALQQIDGDRQVRCHFPFSLARPG